MRTPISKHDINSPEKVLLSSLRDLQEGKVDTVFSFVRRALVVAIDHIGGRLEQIPKKNPKNSIRARIISEPSPHAFLENDDLPVFWPLFPYDLMPIKEGEHVYVIFDGERTDHGLWLSRIAEPFEVDDRNITPGIKKYQIDSSSVSEQQVQDTVSTPAQLTVSSEFHQEKVPKFTARVGDRIIEGSNNTIIILGRDRPTDVKSGQTENAGTIDLISGRAKDEDIDFANDKSRVYVSMNTDPDGNFNVNVGDSASPGAAIVIKSDEIRVIARNGMKLVVEGGKCLIDAKEINLGANAQDAAMLGDKFVQAIQPLLQALQAPSPVGLLGQIPIISSPALTLAATNFKTALDNTVLSKKNKVE